MSDHVVTPEYITMLAERANRAVLDLYAVMAAARDQGLSHHVIRRAAGVSTGSVQRVERGELPNFTVKPLDMST